MNTLHLVCPHCNATNRVHSDKLQAAFNAQLAKSDLPLVVDFWAPWCGPCRSMAPAYEKVSHDMHQVQYSKHSDFGGFCGWP